MPADYVKLASGIKLLLMDVDGVLTDGRLYNVPDAAGNMVETKGFDSQDGIALQWLSWKGIKTGLISGRVSPATIERAKQTIRSALAGYALAVLAPVALSILRGIVGG